MEWIYLIYSGGSVLSDSCRETVWPATPKMLEAYMQPADITIHHRARELQACFLLLATSHAHHMCAPIQNTQARSLVAATSEQSVFSGTHFCDQEKRIDLLLGLNWICVRLKCPSSFRKRTRWNQPNSPNCNTLQVPSPSNLLYSHPQKNLCCFPLHP